MSKWRFHRRVERFLGPMRLQFEELQRTRLEELHERGLWREVERL
jgi:hypothetical protein